MATHRDAQEESNQPSITPRPPTIDEMRQEYLSAERAKWLTVDEAAFVLSTSRDTIFRMIDTKSLPTRKEGKVIRIHVDDLRPQTYTHKEEKPCHSK